jgi:2-dehydro-3-deoxygluconokinase
MKTKVVSFGEIMMRLSPPPFQRFTQATSFDVVYGGSEANVAVSLAHFGIDVEHVTRFPSNDLGKTAVAELKKHGVGTNHIVYGAERIGIYFIEHGASVRASKVIYDRADSAFAHITPSMFDWEEILKDAAWFHWSGITPAISQGAADACYDAVRAARKLGVTITGDINYRRNLWQYRKTALDVMPALIQESDIILGGLADFENCLGIRETDFTKACEVIHKKYPSVKKIVTTYRETIDGSHNKFSSAVWNGKALLTSKTYNLNHIIDRIGTGDSYMAGLIYGWLTKKSDQEAIEFATAACAVKHTIPGDVSTATVQEVEELTRGENIGKLLR